MLLARGGSEVALTEFGLATLKLAGSMTSGTHKGAGTPAFKAPELFEVCARTGNPVIVVSRAADVYAFGVTAWCLLADSVAPYPLRDAGGDLLWLQPQAYGAYGAPPGSATPHGPGYGTPMVPMAPLPMAPPTALMQQLLMQQQMQQQQMQQQQMQQQMQQMLMQQLQQQLFMQQQMFMQQQQKQQQMQAYQQQQQQRR